MRAGKLDRQVELKHRVLGNSSATGQRLETYTTYATVWAEKLDVTGREFFSASTRDAELTTRFNIRYRSDVLPTDRLVYGTSDYDILQVSEMGRRVSLTIFAKAIIR